MSIQDGKVTLYFRNNRNRLVIGALVCIQVVLSLILSVSLAAHLIWPEGTRGAAGAPMQIAYEGRLTDSSGNALGGNGTLYCFRFSIYDSPTGGAKLWPATTAATTTATTTDGIFNAIVGYADTLTPNIFDFSTTSTAYLQVDVNTTPTNCGATWESLQPRQQILSSGYALTSNAVYGPLLRTDTVNNRVQIGTGLSVASPVYLGLDIKNTADYVGQSCSTNGLMWYNSVTTQALVCEAGTIQGIGTSGTSTIAAINANGGTAASSGTINFSNSNGVTFGINGNTITASVNAAGGGATLSNFQWPPGQASSFNAVAAQGGVYFGYMQVQNNFSATRAQVLASGSIATNSSGALSLTVVIYTRNVSTLSSLSSASQSFSYTSNASSAVAGLRRISIPINVNATPGDYWYAVRMSTANAGSFTLYGGARSSVAFSGNLGVASATSRQMIVGLGTTTSNAMPASIAFNVLQGNPAGSFIEPWILFSNFDIQ